MQYNIINAPGFYFAAPFQQGPDNQIYVATQDNFIARITNPDKWGEVTVNGSFIRMTNLNPIFTSGVSLPAFIDAGQPMPALPDFSSKATNCSTYRFTVTCFDDYTASWNFGDGTLQQTGNVITHSFAQAGDYHITLKLSNGSGVIGTKTKKISILPLFISITGPNDICTNGVRPWQYFSPVLPGVKYEWSVINGTISGPDNFPVADIKWQNSFSTGTIQLKISRDSCTLIATKQVNITKGPDINWLLSDSICIADSSLLLNASPAGGIFSGPGVSNNVFSPAQAGLGWHQLIYSYANEVTCQGEEEKMIKVMFCNIPEPPSSDGCRELLNGISIAPNPVLDILRLKSQYSIKRFRLFNSSGQKVEEGQLLNNSLSVLKFAAGIYILQVFCADDQTARAFKFIKLN